MAKGKREGGRASRLSRSVITQAALELADQEGQVPTIRAIAGCLGSSPMALYRHVPDKAVLIQFLVDSVYAELGQVNVADCTSAQEVLTAIADHARAVFSRHRWFPRQAAATPPLGTSGLDYTERCLAALDVHGYTGDRASTALGAVMTYATGAALLAGTARTPSTSAENLDPADTSVNLDAWPHVKMHALHHIDVDPTQAGLEALITAL